ncbi:amidohydrolase [Nocardioides marmotae]|uniref:Amidohydrolase n=1 Tax=Nocardioides marmotae TaxID=2663857 RepID=A0A6I3J8M6_9ACTN|nr:amidohydrolase [Nocardioides marmotae]MCR6031320.1 amidohydrolase [Gordonia jinghuaiqii]MBC9733660.1 amidohydrolase [Nocardioides marmotae]MTB84763.1 amidohydrolase [Nocardioides marmotae]MTB94959.1 amidohydrolase [Nocardioides marmotae]QKE02531.1 amidohydrolase [Nocardioides marmotae]
MTRDPRVHDLIREAVEKHEAELVDLRRDLHAHPELSWHEERTCALVAARVEEAGWRVTAMPRSGVVAELGERGPVAALRADLDALPVHDITDDPWRSTVPDVAHACGHDVHTTAVVGAALALSRVHEEGLLGGRVRLLFQPAEEVMPGGAVHLMSLGVLEDVDRIFALHCDPGVDVGQVGLRLGPLTSAADRVEVRLEGRGGHTSRPHLTGDLTFALAKVTTELPAVLSRRMDPRAGVSVVWGMVRAGAAPNVIPDVGALAGTVRILDAVAWADCERIVREVVHEIVAPYGVTAVVDYQRGVPPVVNEPVSNRILARAVHDVLGDGGQVVAPQSLGGEDFGWYLDQVPGAMMRLGTRTPGGPTYDLHQGDLRVDERAIGIGARVLAEAAAAAVATDR